MRSCPHCRAPLETPGGRCPGCGAAVAPGGPGADPLVGKVLDRYRIEACIGVGAMSRVYRARMVAGGHQVAVKVVSAVDSAFNTLAHTVLGNNARTLEDLVKEMLRPMLKSWLDDNLPGLVERIVKSEIERVSRGGR